jgi:AbrB family looped-hinge helix DNA binding protein
MNEVYRAKLNREGRMFVPAGVRAQAGLQPGQEVLLKVTDEGVLITTFDQALKKFQEEVRSLVGPGVSLVDELIAERREEATREERD